MAAAKSFELKQLHAVRHVGEVDVLRRARGRRVVGERRQRGAQRGQRDAEHRARRHAAEVRTLHWGLILRSEPTPFGGASTVADEPATAAEVGAAGRFRKTSFGAALALGVALALAGGGSCALAEGLASTDGAAGAVAKTSGRRCGERLEQLAGRREALRALAGEGLGDDLRDALGHARVVHAHVVGVLRADVHDHLLVARAALNGGRPVRHSYRIAPTAPEIRAPVDVGQGLGLLGRHVERRAEHRRPRA
jgi:hypothetical protein